MPESSSQIETQAPEGTISLRDLMIITYYNRHRNSSYGVHFNPIVTISLPRDEKLNKHVIKLMEEEYDTQWKYFYALWLLLSNGVAIDHTEKFEAQLWNLAPTNENLGNKFNTLKKIKAFYDSSRWPGSGKYSIGYENNYKDLLVSFLERIKNNQVQLTDFIPQRLEELLDWNLAETEAIKILLDETSAAYNLLHQDDRKNLLNQKIQEFNEE